MSLLHLFFPEKKRKSIQRKLNAKRIKLHVENLEDRVVPAGTITLAPNIFLDPALGPSSGPGVLLPGQVSLRSAIQTINTDSAGDNFAVINLSSGEYLMQNPQTVVASPPVAPNLDNNTNGDWTIAPTSSFNTITINGSGAPGNPSTGGGTIIDGQGLDQLFHIFPNANDLTVIFNNVILQHGLAGGSDSLGGAIFFDDAAAQVHNDHLIINNSVLVNNAAAKGGGAIFAYTADVSLTGTVVDLNTTNGGGGGVQMHLGTFSSTRSFFASNVASGDGGAIDLLGPTNLTIILDSTGILANVSGGTGGGYWDNNSGSLILRNGSFVNGNSSDRGSSGGTPGGGGLLIHDHIFTMTGGSVDGNHTAGDGGGIDDLAPISGTMTITGSDISNNTAGEDGGGVANGDNSTPVTGATTVTVGSTFFTANYAGNHGGGFSDTHSTTFTMDGDVITSNYAAFGGGGLYLNSSSGTYNLGLNSGLFVFNNRAGSFSGGGGIDNPSNSVVFDLEQTFIQNNVAGHGGGVSSRATNVTLTGDLFSGDVATTGDGGGFYNGVSTTFLLITNDSFDSNVADGDGGGFYTDAVSVQVNGVQVLFNTSQSNGGGIAFEGHSMVITNVSSTVSLIDGNFAAFDGGGIYAAVASDTAASPSSVIVKAADVIGNRAGMTGGGIDFVSATYSTLTVVNTLIQLNVAGDPGGGVATDGAVNTFNDDVVTLNYTTQGGGGIDLLSNPADTGIPTGVNAGPAQFSSITQNYIANNQAGGGGDGGGILAQTGVNSYVEVVNDDIAFNTAGLGGGGIANEGNSQMDVLFCTIKANIARQGGGIYNTATVATTSTNPGSVTGTPLQVGLGNNIIAGNVAAPDSPLQGPNDPANTGRNGYAIYGDHAFSDWLYTPKVLMIGGGGFYVSNPVWQGSEGPSESLPNLIVGHNYIDAIGSGQSEEDLGTSAGGDFLIPWGQYNSVPWQNFLTAPSYHGGPTQPPGFWSEALILDSDGDCINEGLGTGISNASVQAFFSGGVLVDQVGNHRPITPGNPIDIGSLETD